MTRLIWRAKCRHMDLRTEVRFGDEEHDEPRPYCPQCDGFLTWARWEVTERESPWTSARRDPATNKVTVKHGNTVRRTLRRVK